MGNRKESSTNMQNEKYVLECDLAYAVCKLSGRWKIIILNKLKDGKLRFSELRDQIDGITERMLILQLRELEKEALIKRTMHAAVPPKVDYELTPIAQSLVPIWQQLEDWAVAHRAVVVSNASMNDVASLA